MLYVLEPGLKKCFECDGAYKMFQELKLVFQTHAKDNGNDSQALRDAEINEGRNQEKHQMLMVDKTASFK